MPVRPGGAQGGPGGPRPGGREAIFFVLGVVGIAAPSLGTDGPPRTWIGWLLVILGAAAGSLVATSLRDVVLTGISRLPSISQLWGWVRAVLASLLALGLIVGLGIGLTRAYGYGRSLLRDCEAPLEVPVVTDPDDAGTARALAAQFERSTAADRRGCPAAHLTVFAAPPAEVRSALLHGWDVVEQGGPVVRGPSRDLGPRPMVWLPPSTVEVDRLVDEAPAADGIVPFGRPPIYARTPMVLAAPAGVQEPPVADQRVQLRYLLKQGVSVIRPDPAVSSAGEFALAASLGSPPGGESQPVIDAGRQFEQQLAAALQNARYPLGDASAVLQAYRDLSCQRPQNVVFVLPLQLAGRPDVAGAPLDGDCAAEGRELTVLSNDSTLTLSHPVVVLDWPDARGDAATAMAGRFRDWLFSDAGRKAITAVGLQVPPAAAQQTTSPEPGDQGWPAKLNPGLLSQVDAALEFQAKVRRNVRVVLALDTSLSMATSLGAAQGVVEDFVARLGEQDQIGLFTFGRRTKTLVIPAPAGPSSQLDNRRDQVSNAALTPVPAGETPLWPGIGGAVALMGPSRTGPEDPAPAVVVVTDGRIALGEQARADVRTRARRDGVRVFVVAVGGAGCDARLAGVARQLGGRCAEPGDRRPGGGMDGVAAAIWGAADGG